MPEILGRISLRIDGKSTNAENLAAHRWEMLSLNAGNLAAHRSSMLYSHPRELLRLILLFTHPFFLYIETGTGVSSVYFQLVVTQYDDFREHLLQGGH